MAVNKSELFKDVSELMYQIDFAHDGNDLNEATNDLLPLAFRELLGTELYSGCDPSRRRLLFDQYEILRVLLTHLIEFAEKYAKYSKDEIEQVLFEQNLLSAVA